MLLPRLRSGGHLYTGNEGAKATSLAAKPIMRRSAARGVEKSMRAGLTKWLGRFGAATNTSPPGGRHTPEGTKIVEHSLKASVRPPVLSPPRL